MTIRTQDESGPHGRIHLENISGYQEKLRWSQAQISGTEAVRREILMDFLAQCL